MPIEKLSNRRVKKAIRLFVDIYINRSIMARLTAHHCSAPHCVAEQALNGTAHTVLKTLLNNSKPQTDSLFYNSLAIIERCHGDGYLANVFNTAMEAFDFYEDVLIRTKDSLMASLNKNITDTKVTEHSLDHNLFLKQAQPK